MILITMSIIIIIIIIVIIVRIGSVDEATQRPPLTPLEWPGHQCVIKWNSIINIQI